MKLDSEALNNFVNHAMGLWINPEIERRKKKGMISDKFVLHKSQVVIRPNEIPFVKLNEEVQAEVSYSLKNPSGVRPEQPLYPSDVGERIDIELKDLDPNHGHITIIPYKGNFLVKFDLRTNKKLNQDRQKDGRTFHK